MQRRKEAHGLRSAGFCRHGTRCVALLTLLLAVTLLPGCVLGDLFGVIAGKRDIPARHVLDDRPTVILVEDPGDALGSRTLRHVLASDIGHHLVRNEALSEEPISPRRVAALAAELGADFDRTAIDELGRRLGAEQVIHVLVDSTSLEYAPTVMRPTARAEVKVIDAVEGRRVFPRITGFQGRDAPPPGEPVVVEMHYQGSTGDPGRGRDSVLRRTLTERLAVDIAQLFYEHPEPEPGQSLR